MNAFIPDWLKRRRWQEESERIYLLASRYNEKNFLAFVTPGAGKSIFALCCAVELLKLKQIKQIAIVVNTDNLRSQWIEVAVQFGINLQTEASQACDGYVLTYQQLSDLKFAKIVRDVAAGRKRTLVIIDECHHTSDGKSWGDGLQLAFEKSWRRLLLSGTPFRRDDAKIPFIEYKNSQAKADYSYGYADALRDGVVPNVFFPTFGGSAKWKMGDDEFCEAKFEGLSIANQSRRLNTLIDSEDWRRVVLKAAQDQLERIRKFQPNAGGLAIARDQNHARAIAGQLSKFSGSVRIAISDESNASGVIDDFKSSSDQWLVAVRMVTEGIDIQRLRVGAYFTNIRSELFFRQFVGRFVRIDPELVDQSAFIFLPSHPDLAAFARYMKEDRLHVIQERQSGTGRSNFASQFKRLMPGKALAMADGTIGADGGTYSREELEAAKALQTACGVPMQIETIAYMLRVQKEITQ